MRFKDLASTPVKSTELTGKKNGQDQLTPYPPNPVWSRENTACTEVETIACTAFPPDLILFSLLSRITVHTVLEEGEYHSRDKTTQAEI